MGFLPEIAVELWKGHPCQLQRLSFWRSSLSILPPACVNSENSARKTEAMAAAAVIAVLLLSYLVYVLFYPEEF
jgi:K+-transporting ATPase KdpF subunit